MNRIFFFTHYVRLGLIYSRNWRRLQSAEQHLLEVATLNLQITALLHRLKSNVTVGDLQLDNDKNESSQVTGHSGDTGNQNKLVKLNMQIKLTC